MSTNTDSEALERGLRYVRDQFAGGYLMSLFAGEIFRLRALLTPSKQGHRVSVDRFYPSNGGPPVGYIVCLNGVRITTVVERRSHARDMQALVRKALLKKGY